MFILAACGKSDCAQPGREATVARLPPSNLHPQLAYISGGKFRGDDTRCYNDRSHEKPTTGQGRRSQSLLEVERFMIDRDPTSCKDLEACLESGACPESTTYCFNGFVEATAEVARNFCAWRNARLPSYREWQRAVFGVDGWDQGDTVRPNTPRDYLGTSDRPAMFEGPDGVRYVPNRPPEWTSDLQCVLAGSGPPYDTPQVYDRAPLRGVTSRFRCANSAPRTPVRP